MDRRFAAQLRAAVLHVAACGVSAVLLAGSVAAKPRLDIAAQVAPAPLVEPTGAFGPFRFAMTMAGALAMAPWLDLARTPIARTPSVAVLHHSLDAYMQPHARSRVRDLAELSAAGVEVILDCAVHRDTGAPRDCRTADHKLGGGVAPALASVAWRRLQHLRFDTQAIDPRDPAPLRAKIPMRVAPSDRRDLGPVPPTLRTLREIAWVERPTGSDLERAYPREALRNGIEAVVSASCRLQPDLSAVCVDAVVTPAGDAEHTHMFALAAYEVLAKFRARDVLRDGTTPAAGEWFTGSVMFRMED